MTRKDTSVPPRILLVEDDIINRTLAEAMIHQRGWLITSVENGREAVEVLRHTAFDLVLMDIQMPEMNGFEATIAIRNSEKDTDNHIPIIALTGQALKGDYETCMSVGMDDYVSKPYRTEELFAAMERHLPPEKKNDEFY